uniref:Uncharacterized protein n=1 Tax=Tetranychus urticae TaxID=32264 RepID=T1JQI9_TETUR
MKIDREKGIYQNKKPYEFRKIISKGKKERSIRYWMDRYC